MLAKNCYLCANRDQAEVQQIKSPRSAKLACLTLAQKKTRVDGGRGSDTATSLSLKKYYATSLKVWPLTLFLLAPLSKALGLK